MVVMYIAIWLLVVGACIHIEEEEEKEAEPH